MTTSNEGCTMHLSAYAILNRWRWKWLKKGAKLHSGHRIKAGRRHGSEGTPMRCYGTFGCRYEHWTALYRFGTMHMPSFSERDFLPFARTRASCGPAREQKNGEGHFWPEKTSQRVMLLQRRWPFLNPTSILVRACRIVRDVDGSLREFPTFT